MKYYRRYCGCLCVWKNISKESRILVTIVGCGKSSGFTSHPELLHKSGDIWIKSKPNFTKVKFKDLTEKEVTALVLMKLNGK